MPEKKVSILRTDSLYIDFSDFMDEEELKRLEKMVAETRPSDLMY